MTLPLVPWSRHGSALTALGFSVALFASGGVAFADEARADAGASATESAAPNVRPAVRRDGVAVVATGTTANDAWALATNVYRSSLRPAALDEAHARVLAGEAPKEGAPAEIVELAETRAAVTGEDAPSRRLLASLAEAASASALLVVSEGAGGKPVARLFFAETRTFDAARYAPDEGKDPWTGTVRSVERQRGQWARSGAAAPASNPAPGAALSPVTFDVNTPSKNEQGGSRPFYASGWFWGALGAAAFTGALIFFATRSNDDAHDIPLSVRVPR